MKTIKFCICVGILIVMWSSNCSAFWIWTPQTKRWINPKHAAKATPQKQFNYAKDFFDEGDYGDAAVEFEKLINSFPDSSLAPEAGYFSGLSYQKNEQYHKAFLIYNKILMHYPHSKRISQIVEKMYEVGVIFLEGRKRKIMGLEIMPPLNTAQEVFKSIVDNVPYSEYGDKAQFKLGESYKRMGDYNRAIEAFENVVKNYQESLLVEEARYQIAICSLRVSLPSEYEQETTNKAIRKFEDFMGESPPRELIEEAETAIKQLEDKKAKHEYEIAQFYETSHKYESAIVYYKSIIKNYPETEWAKEARGKLDNIKKRQESGKK